MVSRHLGFELSERNIAIAECRRPWYRSPNDYADKKGGQRKMERSGDRELVAMAPSWDSSFWGCNL